MFKDSRVMDRERTVGSFREAYEKYQASAEQWFDGSIQSIDRRLVATHRLLHAARSHTARLSTSDAHGLMTAAQALEADRTAMEDMRSDLLGLSHRQAKWYGGDESIYAPGTRPNDYSSREEWQSAGNLRGYLGEQADKFPAQDHAVPSLGHDMTQGDTYKPQPKNLGQQDPRNFSGTGDYPVPATIGNPYHSPHLLGPPKEAADHSLTDTDFTGPSVNPYTGDDSGQLEMEPGAGAHWRHPTAKLAGIDKRWVILEAAKFVAANGDALDDSHELATRAHNHAAVQTSTFTSQRSAAMSRAFVAQVVELGRQTYRAPVRRTAQADPDFGDSSIFL